MLRDAYTLAPIFLIFTAPVAHLLEIGTADCMPDGLPCHPERH